MDFQLPPVGEGLFEVELVRWLVGPGDAVARGQSLMEVMSDKATMEVPAPFAGTVTATAAEPGAKVQVGQVVLRYDPAGDNPSPDPSPKKGGEQNLPAAAPPSLPGKGVGGLGESRPRSTGENRVGERS